MDNYQDFEKDVKELEGEETIPEYCSPNAKQSGVIDAVYNRFWAVRNLRNQAFAYFNDRTLIEYIDDSTKRFNSYIEERENIKDWQARVFDPVTRNKLITILAKVSAQRPKAEFFGIRDEDRLKARIIGDLHEFSENQDDGDELIFYSMLEAASKGTVIGYEGYEKKSRKIKEDGKERNIISRKVYGAIVPLEDFYPSSVGVRKIEEMPDCFWVSNLSYGEAKLKFGHYDDWDFVLPGSKITQDAVPFLKDYIDESYASDVQIVRYYNQDLDQFVLLANGVWLNPDENDDIKSLPFLHKKLPFWKSIYEPFAFDFFYGMSLPDKLKGNQDVLNTLYNMMLDQSFLSIFPPFLTSELDEIEDQILVPGRQIPVSDPSGYKELQISPPSNAAFNILAFVKRTLEETSVDDISQGMVAGGRTTATEIERATQAVGVVLSLFARFMEWGVRDKARLRVPNIIQFYTLSLTEAALGEKQFKNLVNVFRLDNVSLADGRKGTKLIRMFANKSDLPSQTETRLEAELKGIETWAITKDYIRNFEVDVRIVPNSSFKESKALERALEIEKQGVYQRFFPDFVNRKASAVKMAEVFDDQPEEVFNLEQEVPQFPPTEEGEASQVNASEALLKAREGRGTANLALRDMVRK